MVMSKSDMTVRCYTPEDSLRCRTMFTQGRMEACIPMIKTAHARFFKIAVVLFVPVIAVAVKWSMWTLLILYLAAYLLMSMIASFYIYRMLMNQINGCLQSDLLDIGKYYSGDSCMFVAECGGRVIGMVGVAKKEHHKLGVAELQRMSVCSSARRKGIGKLLVNKVVEYCKEKKYDKIILHTTSVQHAAVALYKKCGFNLVKSQQLTYSIFNLRVFHFEKN